MKPTRPLDTFDKWYRHEVWLTMDRKGWRKVDWFLDRQHWVRNEDYLMSYTSNERPILILHFDSIYHASIVAKRFTGYYKLHPRGEGPMRNKPIFTHFTMDDLKAIFGDPLPVKVQYLLEDLRRRNVSYFTAFQFMHHEWCDRDWWPEAFVYIRRSTPVAHAEQLIWCQDNDITEFETHACGMWEFGQANQAMLFKLAWGEDRLPFFTARAA